MKILLIEDELPAIDKLERYIGKFDPQYQVVARLSSVVASIGWLSDPTNSVDLIFMDIQLSDGLSFEIFDSVTVLKPVIFVTAFDEYAIDAFKVNSIDYILKPITFSAVSKALNKLKSMEGIFPSPALQKTVSALQKPKVKERFLVRLGNHIHSIQARDIALFFADGRTVFIVTKTGKKMVLDYNLEQLARVLDSGLFFRANRTYIVNLSYISDVVVYSNSRLKVVPAVAVEKDILIPRDKVSAFKAWFGGGS